MSFLSAVSLLLLLSHPPTSTPPQKDLNRSIDSSVAPYVEYHAFSGVVLLARGDSVLAERSYGMANYELGIPNRTDTRFRIASITKWFTLIVVTRLANEKKLSLDDPLAKFAPAFPKADKITVSQLLYHRSGIRDPDKLRGIISASYTPAEVVDLLAKEPLGSEPGETYSYTTANYAVLAFIVEKVTGQTFAQVVRRYVYEPAGMIDAGDISTVGLVPRLASGYMPDPYSDCGVAINGPEDTSWKTGGGSGYATARDLHRFLRAFYGGKLLPSTPAIDFFPLKTAFGKRMSQASGSFPGANASMSYFPDDALSVVVLSNSYSSVTGAIARNIAAISFGEPYKIPSAPAVDGSKPIDPRLFGTWSLEGFPNPFKIEMRHGRPVVFWSPVRQSAFLRVSDDQYFMPLDWATAIFRFAADGSAEGTWTAPWSDKPLKITRPSEVQK